VLNGQKHLTSGATESDFMLVFAVTEPQAPNSERLTAFLVPTKSPGVDASQDEPCMGLRGLSHAYVSFDGVHVDDYMRIGAVGEGHRIMTFAFAAERVDIAARALGCATRAFEEARAYSAHRETFGRAIRSYQAVSHKLADMRATIDATRLLILRAARLYDEVLESHGPEKATEACNEESSIAKLFAAEQSFRVCDQAMQILGGVGYKQGAAVESMLRDSRVFRFGGGTDEINRHVIQRDEYRRLERARDS
jgi:alkylation response protein AidB-like acyl-CoA dehydrogenase